MMPNKTRLLALGSVLLVLLSGCAPVVAAPIAETVYVDRIIYVDRVIEVPVEVAPSETPAHQQATITASFTVAPELREFENIEALRTWCDDNRSYVQIIDIGTTADFGQVTRGDAFDCDDYAERLQKTAIRDGYLINLQLVENGMIYGQKVNYRQEPHVGCTAMIGNDVYYIEPTPHGIVTWVAFRD